MIQPNETPRDYEFRMDVSSTYSRDATGYGCQATHVLEITWGQAFSVGTHGIRLTVVNSIDMAEPASGETPDWEVTLETPWDVDQVFSGSGSWLGQGGTPYETLLQIDGLELEVIDCNGGTISFDELRLYLDDTLEYTLGAQSEGFLGYDVRENKAKLSATPLITPTPDAGEPALCTMLGMGHSVAVTAAIGQLGGYGGGFRHRNAADTDWVYYYVEIDDYPPPTPASVVGCPVCDCVTAVPVPELDASRAEGTDSWHVWMQADAVDELEETLLGTFECACQGGSGSGTWIWDVYDMVWTWQAQTVWGDATPRNKGVTETDREAGSACTCEGEMPAFTTDDELGSDDGVTHARYRGTTANFLANSYCCDETQQGVCDIGGGGTPPTCESCSGLTDPDDFCQYQAYVEISHPTEPECTTLERNPWNFHLEHDHYHRATIEDGDVWYRRVDRNAPVSGFDIEVEVTSSGVDAHPRMAVDPLTQRMHLVFVRTSGPDLYLATSDDDGETWSTPALTIADGRFPTVACARDGTVVVAAFKYNSGSSGPGKIYTSVRKLGEAAFSTPAAIEDDSADLEFEEDTFHITQAFDGEQTWVLVARPSGSSDVREYRSYDDCQTFEII